jgi:hypothetical protein
MGCLNRVGTSLLRTDTFDHRRLASMDEDATETVEHTKRAISSRLIA